MDITCVRLSQTKGQAVRAFVSKMSAARPGGGQGGPTGPEGEEGEEEESVGYARRQARSNAFYGLRSRKDGDATVTDTMAQFPEMSGRISGQHLNTCEQMGFVCFIIERHRDL